MAIMLYWSALNRETLLYIIQKVISEHLKKGVDNMCKLFNAYEKQIKEYCISNNINFDKVKNLPQCWGKNDIWLQYYDPEKGKQGLNDETPAPIVLKIYVDNGNVTIEQTEYTKKYLS